MDMSCEVLVVGAGPTGLTHALALKAQGVDVRIIDSAPSRHTEARATAIHARTLEMLAPYGVADRIVAYANPVHCVCFFGPDGREVMRKHPAAIDSPYPPLQNLQQWRTEALLLDQLESHGVLVERAANFIEARQEGDVVLSTIERNGRRATVASRFLVGCDGAHSAVRHAAGIRLEGGDYPERWVAAELAREDRHVRTEARFLFNRDRVVLLIPCDMSVLFVATLRDGEFPDQRRGHADPAEVLAIYERALAAHPARRESVVGVPWAGVFAMHHCVAPDYRRGRIFLAGDAAHLCSAAGGNGMNAGMQDAINLAWRMAAHLRLGADSTILDGYSLERHEAFELINAGSDAAHKLLVAHDPSAFSTGGVAGLRAMLARVLHPAPAGPSEADRALGEVHISYAKDPLLADHAATGRLRAGMRVPPTADLTVGFGSPRPWSALHDGFNWTAILAVASRDDLRASDVAAIDQLAVRRLRGRVRTVVAAGDAFAWNTPRPTLYLVRPDGYVAFRADAAPGEMPSTAALSAWFDRGFTQRAD